MDPDFIEQRYLFSCRSQWLLIFMALKIFAHFNNSFISPASLHSLVSWLDCEQSLPRPFPQSLLGRFTINLQNFTFSPTHHA